MEGLRVYSVQGAYPPEATGLFDFNQLDAFHHPEVLTVIYGDAWHSILITDGDGKQAFLHSYTLQPLPDGNEGFDIEPFIGYAGPVLSAGSDAEFREAALARYSEHCLSQGIVAEIMRFNPVLENARDFEGSGLVKVFAAKDIVVTSCFADEAAQLASFTTKCRSSVKRGLRDCTFGLLDKATEWDAFVDFYYASLDRIGAERKWYYSPELFSRAAQSPLFQVHVVSYQGNWASLSLVIEHPLAGYYFTAASSPQPVQGANELLVFGIAQSLAKRGITHLILGGGNTASEDDYLLRFKSKFALEMTPLMLGRIVHNENNFDQLVNDAVAARPELAEVRFFLKYRL